MAKQIDYDVRNASITLEIGARRRRDRFFRLIPLAFLATFALAFAPVLAQHEYADIPIVADGKTVKISPNVYVIPAEGRRGVPNVGIVVGSRATLVVDPGMGLRSGEAVLREVKQVGKGTDLYIVNTHFHPEHTTGELAFPAHTKIVRAKVQQQDIDELGLKSVANFAQRSKELAEVVKEATYFRRPTEIFEREKSIDLGGVQVRLIWLGPGHTRGDTAVFVEGAAVLFSGDLAMKEVFPAFTAPESNIDTWLKALGVLAQLGAAHVVGAHSGMGDLSIVSAYREFFTALRGRVAEMKAQGKSSEETAKTLRAEFAGKYPNWDQAIRVHTVVEATYAQIR